MTALWLLAALLTKHLIVDFPLQPRWMYANKGVFGHPGGIAHAGLHGIATAIIVSCWLASGAAWFGIADMALHYAIDLAKVRINQRFGLRCDNSERFWLLLGLDQWLHQMTYVGIAAIVTWGAA